MQLPPTRYLAMSHSLGSWSCPLAPFSAKQLTLVISPHSAQAGAIADDTYYTTSASDDNYLLYQTPDHIAPAPQAQLDCSSPSSNEQISDSSAGTTKAKKRRKKSHSDEQRRARAAIEQKRQTSIAQRIEHLRCLLGPAAHKMSKGDVLNYGEQFLQRGVR